MQIEHLDLSDPFVCFLTSRGYLYLDEVYDLVAINSFSFDEVQDKRLKEISSVINFFQSGPITPELYWQKLVKMLKKESTSSTKESTCFGIAGLMSFFKLSDCDLKSEDDDIPHPFFQSSLRKTITELEKMDRVRPVTESWLHKLGYTEFAWVCPSEVLAGWVFPQGGGFVYRNKDDDNRSCFMCVVPEDVGAKKNFEYMDQEPDNLVFKGHVKCHPQKAQFFRTQAGHVGSRPLIHSQSPAKTVLTPSPDNVCTCLFVYICLSVRDEMWVYQCLCAHTWVRDINTLYLSDP